MVYLHCCFRQKGNKKHDKVHKDYKYKRRITKTSKFNDKRKMSIRNMINKNLVKEAVSIAGNLVTLVKTANKNMVN